MVVSSEVLLNNGVKIPLLGFGTWQLKGENLLQPLTWALEAGYRHIDTAMVYMNEKIIGKVIKKSDIPREELFITTKLWIWDFEPTKALEAIDVSLKKLGLNYVDLYLVHWPAEGFLDIWKPMEQMVIEGKARAIGVSNFLIHHLEKLREIAEIPPAVNQIECSPYNFPLPLYDYCKKNNINIAAYSPLTRGLKISDTKLLEIAADYQKTAAQILLRWNLQKGSIIIPKASTKARIIENSNIFDFTISAKDMKLLDSFNEHLRVPGSPKHKQLAEKYLDSNQ